MLEGGLAIFGGVYRNRYLLSKKDPIDFPSSVNTKISNLISRHEIRGDGLSNMFLYIRHYYYNL